MTDEEESETPKKSSGEASGSKPKRGAPAGRGASSSREKGFFTLYKKGQGYWTRMGTVAGAALIGLLSAQFIFEEFDGFAATKGVADFLKRVHLEEPLGGYLLVSIFCLGFAALAFWIMNKPTNVDFLIATDSEMKKVNWTSRKELIGSTRIVIIFMFVMAMVLFLYDMFFQTVFYWMGVLKTPPPFLPFKH